ncbi:MULTISPECIES: hypothetical protein [Methanobacterium]|jgi:hypothetical protein|uniref:Uncharacterized protein n=1 Tax=Methanobacterium veterum TaxID=408577 RepID=A0A9E5A076_9EURY|nr:MULTISPECIES: hypothetical protein [Methanobacterium]MCZ3367188.1 hypothetical protein [Methanobacterium veterum]MCZ3373664.1 hypothetical protein [Methanobacterium veterum]
MQFFTETQELFTLIFAIHFTLIIDRVHRNYNPYDTYNAWKGQLHAIRRLFLSWAVMYILPLLNFAAFLIILGAYDISFDPTPRGTLNIVLVGLSSFFDFGYYRIFESILYLSPKTFYTDKEADEMMAKDRGEFQAHFIPGILYVIASFIMIFIVII